MNRNKTSLKNNRIKSGLATFLLCLYLFVMLVTGVLHPLSHCHEGHSCHLPTDITPCHPEEKDSSLAFHATKEPHEKAFSSYCVFCHTYVYHPIVAQPSGHEVIIAVCETLYEEYFGGHYSSGFFADKHSRAPPFPIA